MFNILKKFKNLKSCVYNSLPNNLYFLFNRKLRELCSEESRVCQPLQFEQRGKISTEKRRNLSKFLWKKSRLIPAYHPHLDGDGSSMKVD